MSKLLLCVLIWPLLTIDCLFAGDSCVVAEDLPGTCKLLQECAPLITEMQNAGTPIPASLRRKLQGLACGFEFDEPLVCCQSPFTNADQVIPPNWLHAGMGGGGGGGNSWVTKPTPSTADPWHTNRPQAGSMDPWGSETQPTTDTSSKYGNQDSLTGSSRPGMSTSSKNDMSEIPSYVSVTSHKNLHLLPENCGDLDSDRIWGGSRTRLSEMPWMVLIAYDSPQGPKLSCGGTLITERYVLTAAHCVSFLGNSLTLSGIVLGEHDVRTNPDCERVEGDLHCAPESRNVTIDRVIAHPGYSPQNLYDDIALVRLADPADFSTENMMPICLPTTQELQVESLVGKKAVVAGWGATEDGFQSPVLLSVTLPVIGNRDCQTAYNGSPRIHPTQLCAGGEPDKDSCGGDSGGPLMYPGLTQRKGTRYVQRGIVSYGSKRCGAGSYPGVYTNVAKYIDWILDNISS